MIFQEIQEARADPIFGLLETFHADPRKEKINLMVGIYKDDHLRAELLHSVRRAKDQLFSKDLMADYLPIDGLSDLIELLAPLMFGQKMWTESKGRIYGAHTTGGTGALRIGAEFLSSQISKKFYLPNPTWPNHRSILERAGGQIESYPYYSQEKKGFDLHAMLAFLEKLPKKAVVLLHACCHNPTGSDPTLQEWKQISALMMQKELIPFFDFAYHGLGDGIEKDAEAIRLFVEEGHEMLIAYSCSKNFSMYCQRVGALFIVSQEDAIKKKIASQVKQIIRALYSNPPAHGAKVVVEILKEAGLKSLWLKDLETMRRRLNLIRETFVQRLISKIKKKDFEYLKHHKGMFSFIDLNKSQVQKMMEKYAIYMTENGRVSIAGLTHQNVDYVVNALQGVCEEN